MHGIFMAPPTLELVLFIIMNKYWRRHRPLYPSFFPVITTFFEGGRQTSVTDENVGLDDKKLSAMSLLVIFDLPAMLKD